MILKWILTNWMTSAAGVGLAAWQLYQNGMTWKAAITAALLAALGLAAKDRRVTGGTVPQTPEAEHRVVAE